MKMHDGSQATQRECGMSRTRDVRWWGRWVAVLAGIVVALKSAVFVLRPVFRIAGSEVQARGKDEAFLLNLATRRRSG